MAERQASSVAACILSDTSDSECRSGDDDNVSEDQDCGVVVSTDQDCNEVINEDKNSSTSAVLLLKFKDNCQHKTRPACERVSW